MLSTEFFVSPFVCDHETLLYFFAEFAEQTTVEIRPARAGRNGAKTDSPEPRPLLRPGTLVLTVQLCPRSCAPVRGHLALHFGKLPIRQTH